ncbi:MAG: response regulator transcription factor [Bacteroidetes bacterium]|nr:response regulator transcription factor [Bacteroidota bacterium]
MLRTVIIDDEKRGRETLTNLVKECCQNVEIAATAGSKDEGIAAINQQKPDFIFLDIEMPGGSGFKLLKELGNIKPYVIFVTAFDHYAIKAIRFSALDYLLKPINVDELYKAVEKVEEMQGNGLNGKLDMLLRNINSTNNYLRQIALPTLQGLELVETNKILYCEADANYTTLHLLDGVTVVVTRILKEFEELLAESNFVRIHHSYLINLSHLRKYVRGKGGSVIMKDGTELGVSVRKKEVLINKLGSMQ